MARLPLLRGGLLGLLLAGGLAVAALAWPLDQGPVYAVAQLQAGLADQPQTWLGRTVRVRGVVRGCPYGLPGPCASWQPELRHPVPQATEAGAGLLLVPVPARPDALTARLRRIPWVRALVRGPQVVQ
jgi:hypothetical protein